ncbi:hypothetical protein [Curtobacterium sp. ZW137]
MILGSGRQLFGPGQQTAFDLRDVVRTSAGLVVSTYDRR